MLLATLVLGCASTQPLPGVVHGVEGASLTSIPGPMPAFGPFDTFSDALKAACPLILSQPRATAGRPTEQNFSLRWRRSREYCAWLYYTPDQKFEMSMLAAGTPHDAPNKRTCDLPATVDDPRYSPGSLGYVFVLHNHPYDNVLSDRDIRFIVAMAVEHGVTVKTQAGVIPLSIVAFFSHSGSLENPPCDGFFQYVPATGELLRWLRKDSDWRRQVIGRVEWLDDTRYRIVRN
ncbi:hypothetical protein [Corallococcus sp. CA047B]|uniref:hypothetical protein n=1 Tax=Corallococcus sp. CA047B TaxID=2316729 RepID=UPI001F1C1420|nr:hypothetical protein [Corallococcus sp. CA047B]